MSRRGVTQELIDETRASTENQMLKDLHDIAERGGDIELPDKQGAAPVCFLPPFPPLHLFNHHFHFNSAVTHRIGQRLLKSG